MKKYLLLAFAWATGSIISLAQVTQISANKDLEFVGLVSPAKAIFASNTDHRIYASDGTAAGTLLLSSSITFEDVCGVLGNKVLFKGTNTAAGSELFVTDGTVAGTNLLKDINTGIAGSQIDGDVALLNGYVYFTAVTAAEGREIWKSNGTTAGTTLLKDVVPGTGSSNTAANYNLYSNGTYLLFSAQTGSNGYELWKSDGSTAGTTLLSDINAGAASSNATAFFKLGNIVLFEAQAAATGIEIWKTDGTATGTVLVKDINPGPANSNSFFNTYLYEFNGRAYFDANDGVHGEELWYTDGTTANTALLKDIQSGPKDSFAYLFNAIKVGNKFIFASGELLGGRAQLWQSDGTTAGTTLLKDFDGGQIPIILPAYEVSSGSSIPQLFQGNKFFFIANTLAQGLEMWVSDGSANGTTIVKDINSGPADAIGTFSYQYTVDAFYFAASNGNNGTELWKTNGTGSGTILVADINIGAGDSDPEIWPVFNNKLTLSANNGDNAATDLYVLNGSVSPLPIKLGDFSVITVGSDAILHWNTTQETNTDKFMVQRSLDGIHFQTIGSVQAAGQSTSKQSYSFTDATINQYGKELLYYRLQIMDKDAKAELTKIVTVNLSGNQWNIRLVNNPVRSALQIMVGSSTGITTFRVIDVSGKSCISAAMIGSGAFTIPIQDLPAGIYFLVSQNGKAQKTEKFGKN